MATVVRITGIDEMQKALKRMEREAPKELLRVNRMVARTILVPEAKRRAPQGPHEGGGQIVPIVESIHAVVNATSIVLTAGGRATPHASPEEWGGTIPRRGWKGHGRTAKRLARAYGGRTVTRIAKRPYIGPTIEAKMPEVVAAYEKMLAAALDRFKRD